MHNKFIIIITLICLSVSLSIDDTGHHFRMYVTADVKGETEPCG